MLNETLYTCEPIGRWEQLMGWYRDYSATGEQWLFRGVSDSEWGFQTSLERAVKNFGIDSTKHNLLDLEGGLMRRFKRQCHHYLQHLPNDENTIEWLAMMQHYGAPTRLLDWTHSLFVGLFFAVENSSQECAVWALNHDWTTENAKAVLPAAARDALKNDRNREEANTFDLVFRGMPPIPFVLPIKPFKFNDRLVMQQGSFVCPGNVDLSFEENLEATLLRPGHDGMLIKLVIKNDAALRKEIIKNLNRMNMNAATLYPGLAGFARSLRTLLVEPEILRP
jgi:hypothetical protein